MTRAKTTILNDFDLILNDYLGKRITPLHQGKLQKVLDKQFYYTLEDGNKRIMTRAEHIFHSIFNESHLVDKLEIAEKTYTYKLYREDEKAYYVITKSEYDFGLWIIENGLNNKETYYKRCEELWQIEEKKQAEIEQQRLGKERSEAIEKEEKEQFEIWLKNEIENYKDTEKIALANAIFEHHYGMVFKNFALLVLIDNIDKKGCKEELIDHLHTGNKGSREIFKCITGISLGSTNKEAKEKILSIKEDDYIETVKEFKPRKKSDSEGKELVMFYKHLKDGDWIVSYGTLWKYKGFELYIDKTKRNTYRATEGKTGIAITYEMTSIGYVKEEFKKTLARETKQKVITMIDNMIDIHGLSPLYSNQTA
jgi:hypothetical protein